MRAEPSPSRNNTYRGNPVTKPHNSFISYPVTVLSVFLSQLVCYKSI